VIANEQGVLLGIDENVLKLDCGQLYESIFKNTEFYNLNG